MYTSIVLVALSGVVSVPAENVAETPWMTDYVTAYQKGQSDKKPLAMIFGKGADGAKALCKDGSLDKDVLDTMKANYVCLYVDVDTASGKRISDGLQVTSTPSLMLTSDTGGVLCRHSGAVTKEELTTGLKKYADPARKSAATSTSLTAETPVTVSDPAATVGSPAIGGTVVPASYPATYPGVGGGFVQPYTPGLGGFAPAGGCANGRCGR